MPDDLGLRLDGMTGDSGGPPEVDLGQGRDGGGPGECRPVLCAGLQAACGDCLDGDGDGLIDAEDPDCLSACDSSESRFGGVFPDNPPDCRRDCAFDVSHAPGDDGCSLDRRCDPMATGVCAPDGSACASPSDECIERCLPVTPNGCDCFGCCELPLGSGQWVDTQVYEEDGAGCTLATATDPTRCPPCTPQPDCLNPCGSCERCVGGNELPEGCAEQACPPGRDRCGRVDDRPCPAGEWCVTGCCVASRWWSGAE